MSNIVFIIGIILIFCNIYFFIKLRKDIRGFSKRVEFIVEKIINEEEVCFEDNKENLLSKVEHKFKKLYDSQNLKNKRILEEKEKVQSLIGDISHQVKTPLSNINLYGETLLNRELEKSMKEKFLKCILDEERKLDFLMDSLLKTSRLQSGLIKIKKEKVCLKEMVEETAISSEKQAEDKEIKVKLNLREKLVLGDRKWMKEAILNIIENSIKYSNKKSEIEIKIEEGEIFSCVEIKDYGIGISEKNLNNIFKRFFREEDVYEEKGVGIGLYLARYIVEELEGFIKVESIKGEGSTFKIYFLNITNL